MTRALSEGMRCDIQRWPMRGMRSQNSLPGCEPLANPRCRTPHARPPGWLVDFASTREAFHDLECARSAPGRMGA